MHRLLLKHPVGLPEWTNNQNTKFSFSLASW